MRAYSPALLAYLAARGPVSARALIWVRARNRTTGAEVPFGLWTGDDARPFTIAGGSRTYLGGSRVLKLEPMVFRTGLTVQTWTFSLSGVDPDVAAMLQTHDPRMAPVEVHRAVFAHDTAELLEEPHRVFKGQIDEVAWPRPALGGEASIEVRCVSSSVALTRTLTLRKSDESQRLRSGDRGRRYAALAGKVATWWGQKPEGGASAPLPWMFNRRDSP